MTAACPGTYWDGRRVFVTGHTGFMGGWLCEALLLSGAEVTGYALPAADNDGLFAATGLGQRMRSITGDVRHSDTVTEAMARARPEFVFHLAAQPLVRLAHAAPVETFSTNIMGTINVLEAMRHTSTVAAAVIVTTDKVYDNREWPWGYRETDTLGGREPYGASKACAELAVDAYRHSYCDDADRPLGLATVRAGNVIGGGDRAADRIVPDAIRAFAAGRPLAVRNPDAVRPWQHVLEPVAGMMTLAQRLRESPDRLSGPWNMGPEDGDSRTVAWLADRLCTAWGHDSAWHTAPAPGCYEARLLTLSSAKARADLGWRCRWNAATAVARTAEWYRAAHDGADPAGMAALTRSQINRYLNGDDSGATESERNETSGPVRAVA